MRSSVTAVAYPTIPIVFVSSVHPDRIPLHNSMGLAVTDVKEKTRVKTIVRVIPERRKLEFVLNGEVSKEKQEDMRRLVKVFEKKSGNANVGLSITSDNHKVYSGSSDAGAAALVVALNELFETSMTQDELSDVSQILSESAIRAMYGGISEINVDGYPKMYGKLVADKKDLEELKIFAVGFDYPSRVSAEEIFHATRSSPFYKYRLEMIPQWIAKIKLGLLHKDWDTVFAVAEENCANAHYLYESVGLRSRRKEMMNVVIDVEDLRKQGLSCYWTAGGGKVINIFTWGEDADKVKAELTKKGHAITEYKVASGAKVTNQM
ncbi:MAG: hypothetical protein NWF04_10345 [Candidatus Bathyarchaeota archaeon]|nr:hypothetical protein [Candidatus Bathyarchaeota archaeon]